MLKKNDILSSDFFDFEIFVYPDKEIDHIDSVSSKQIKTLVVYSPQAEADDLNAFLSSILTAAKLDMSTDVFILKATVEDGFSFIRIKTQFPIEKVILFGIPSSSLGLHLDLKPYRTMTFQNTIFLLADSLEIIKEDVNKKRALWNCLQEIYLK